MSICPPSQIWLQLWEWPKPPSLLRDLSPWWSSVFLVALVLLTFPSHQSTVRRYSTSPSSFQIALSIFPGYPESMTAAETLSASLPFYVLVCGCGVKWQGPFSSGKNILLVGMFLSKPGECKIIGMEVKYFQVDPKVWNENHHTHFYLWIPRPTFWLLEKHYFIIGEKQVPNLVRQYPIPQSISWSVWEVLEGHLSILQGHLLHRASFCSLIIYPVRTSLLLHCFCCKMFSSHYEWNLMVVIEAFNTFTKHSVWMR